MPTIIDCYTDEPSGLGVPPFLGTYPRYIAGMYEDITYLTIDDLRLWFDYKGKIKEPKESQKTNIKVYNLTKNHKDVQKILNETDEIIVIAGIHAPGKYLSALPGTLAEISKMIKELNCKKVLAGPALYGTSLEGGRFFERNDMKIFDELKDFEFTYPEIKELSLLGASIIKQIPDERIIEIETGRGCSAGKCSFCTEPLKNKFEVRPRGDIVREVKELYKLGCRHFRLGKQSSYYAHPDAVEILKDIRKACPDLKTLHIDNVNPGHVITTRGIEITKAIVKYCTPGNVAALGVESFDKEVIKANCMNCSPEVAFKAIKIINEYGSKTSENGLPYFLPGINLLFGLISESKTTHEENMNWLRKILDEDLLLRRINIRQVAVFENTPLQKTAGNKFLKKNKKFYWKWRNDVRQNIDLPMLKKLVPEGTVLKNVIPEIYDGKTTFGRQFGTYPLIVGIKGRIELKKPVDVKVTKHMLRSVSGEVV